METKKNRHADLARKTGLFFNIGLILSIALVLAAFEWKSYNENDLLKLAAVKDNFEKMIEIPSTEILPPPLLQNLFKLLKYLRMKKLRKN